MSSSAAQVEAAQAEIRKLLAETSGLDVGGVRPRILLPFFRSFSPYVLSLARCCSGQDKAEAVAAALGDVRRSMESLRALAAEGNG